MAGWYDMPDNNKQAQPKLNETCKMLQGLYQCRAGRRLQ